MINDKKVCIDISQKKKKKKVCIDAGTSVEGVIGNSTRKNISWNT